MRILVSAYACSPYQGSEPGVGWGFIYSLSEFHELHVIVEEEKFKADIEKWLSNGGKFKNSVTFYYIRKKRNRLLRKIWPPSYYWFYKKWQRDAYILAKKIDNENNIDVFHQLTMVGFREPGFLYEMGKPFVWGPVGGMGLFPFRFLKELNYSARLYYFLYNLINVFHMRFLARPRKAALSAGSGLITATTENYMEALRFWKVHSTVIPEVGLPPVSFKTIQFRSKDEPIRLIWSGLHIPRKGLGILLEALSSLSEKVNWHLHVLGDGPESVRWAKLAENLGISSRVTFVGWVDRDKSLRIMRNSHVFIATSLRDLTSTVIIEALACGLPVICNDHCGFADVVNDECGIKVKMDSPESVRRELASSVERIYYDEEYRQFLAKGALERSKEYDWKKKVDLLNSIYHRVVNERHWL